MGKITIPLLKKPGVDSKTDRPFNINIVMDDKIKNKIWRVEHAEMICTCDDFRTKICHHIKQHQGVFNTWTAAQLRRVRGELTNGSPVEILANTISDSLGFPIGMAEIVRLSGGDVAVQWDDGLSSRYSKECGFGSFGKRVYFPNGLDEQGIIYLLSNEPEFTKVIPEEFASEIFVGDLPALPPNCTTTPQNELETKAVNSLYAQASGIVIAEEDWEEDTGFNQDEGDDWAIFWASLAGMYLKDRGWSNVSRYIPDSLIDGQPVGALAIDLSLQWIKAIPEGGVDIYSKNIPPEYKTKIGHVHLPWGEEHESTVHTQVIVRHPANSRLNKNDAIQVLTTNLWQEFYVDGPVELLLAQVAGVMIRLGHAPGSLLYYGDRSWPLGELAKSAIIDEVGGAWELNANAWDVLQNQVIPAIFAGDPIPDDVYGLDCGEEWRAILPEAETINV